MALSRVAQIGATICSVAMLAGAGCSDATPTEAPDDTSSTAPGMGAEAEGTCWQVPRAVAGSPDYWYDDSPTVPCTEPHTTETAFVYELAEPTQQAVEPFVHRCVQYVRGYVGISDESWVPWGSALYLPSTDQIADGASWVRCDVLIPDSTGTSGPREHTVSARDVATDRPDELWACLDQAPDPEISQPYVACSEPHAYEATGDIIHIKPVTTYPAADTRRHEERLCRPAIPKARPGVVESVLWGAVLVGDDLSGACLFHRVDGRPLPPRTEPAE